MASRMTDPHAHLKFLAEQRQEMTQEETYCAKPTFQGAATDGRFVLRVVESISYSPLRILAGKGTSALDGRLDR